MSKYFIAKSTGVILKVNEAVKVGEGKHSVAVIDQYVARPEIYTPCTKDGTPLKVTDEKETKSKKTKSKKTK